MLKPLLQGGCIGICAPAGPVNTDKFTRAIEKIHGRGFNVKQTANVLSKQGFLSASDTVRKRELEELFCDQTIDAVWCARGGVGTSRLLTTLDYKRIAESGKTFLGFSDLTAFQWALWKMHRTITFSGPLAIEFDNALTSDTIDCALSMLAGRTMDNWLSCFPNVNPQIVRKGAREIIAPLLPGNLTMISTLLGTPWMPDTRGSIMVIEDVAEPPYRVDRLLFHLKNSGALNDLAALVVGDFGWEVDDNISRQRLLESILDATRGTNYPIITGFPYGHGATRMTLPVGAPVRLSLSSDNIALTFAISPFAPEY